MILRVVMIALIFKSKQDLKFRMTAMKLNFIHIRDSEKNKNVQLLNREDDNDDNLDPIELEFYSLLNHN